MSNPSPPTQNLATLTAVPSEQEPRSPPGSSVQGRAGQRRGGSHSGQLESCDFACAIDGHHPTYSILTSKLPSTGGEEIVPTPQKCQMLGVKRASFSSAATCGRGEHEAE